MSGKLDKSTVERRIADCASESIALAIMSALIARADMVALKAGISALVKRGVSPACMHEIIIQSYLFCGFPRMLDALFCLAELINPKLYLGSANGRPQETLAYTAAEAGDFETRGRELIRRIYADKYPRLEYAVWEMSPVIFRLIVIEGYGKTLSRPGLEVVTRELAVVAALTVDGQTRQLQAHLRGAFNVGASLDQLADTLDALTEIAGDERVKKARSLLLDLKTASE
ncbi:MAG: carboxymuconolactone decarboxylase family protein [Candidatus Zixiibacteriota bacterium]